MTSINKLIDTWFQVHYQYFVINDKRIVMCRSSLHGFLILLIYPYPTYVQRTVKGCFGYISRFYQNYVIASYSDIHLFRRKYYISLFVLSFFCYMINIIEWQLLPSVIYMMVFTSYSCYKHYEQLHSRSRQKQMELKAK